MRNNVTDALLHGLFADHRWHSLAQDPDEAQHDVLAGRLLRDEIQASLGSTTGNSTPKQRREHSSRRNLRPKDPMPTERDDEHGAQSQPPNGRKCVAVPEYQKDGGAGMDADDPFAFLTTFDTMLLSGWSSPSDSHMKWLRRFDTRRKHSSPPHTTLPVPDYTSNLAEESLGQDHPNAVYWPVESNNTSGLFKGRLGHRYDRVALGSLAGRHEKAHVDTQADNLISADFLKETGRQYDRTRKRTIRLADGKGFSTLGMVSLPWTFSGENLSYNVEFNVVPSRFCRYAVTLGGHFLNSSQTLSRFSRRMSKIARLPGLLSRVCSQGGEQLRMHGTCEGEEVYALPDTASDVRLVSLDFARRSGRLIDTSPASCVDLELPGGRVAQTSGSVSGLSWSFGDEEWLENFYVLEGLPCDVLLDDEFLERTNAFEDYAHCLFQDGDDQDGGLYLTIMRLRKSDPSLTAEQATRIALDTHEDRLLEKLLAINNSHDTTEQKVADRALIDLEQKAILELREALNRVARNDNNHLANTIPQQAGASARPPPPDPATQASPAHQRPALSGSPQGLPSGTVAPPGVQQSRPWYRRRRNPV